MALSSGGTQPALGGRTARFRSHCVPDGNRERSAWKCTLGKVRFRPRDADRMNNMADQAKGKLLRTGLRIRTADGFLRIAKSGVSGTPAERARPGADSGHVRPKLGKELNILIKTRLGNSRLKYRVNFFSFPVRNSLILIQQKFLESSEKTRGWKKIKKTDTSPPLAPAQPVLPALGNSITVRRAGKASDSRFFECVEDGGGRGGSRKARRERAERQAKAGLTGIRRLILKGTGFDANKVKICLRGA